MEFQYLIPPQVFYGNILPKINSETQKQIWLDYFESLEKIISTQIDLFKQFNIWNTSHFRNLKSELKNTQFYLCDIQNLEV